MYNIQMKWIRMQTSENTRNTATMLNASSLTRAQRLLRWPHNVARLKQWKDWGRSVFTTRSL